MGVCCGVRRSSVRTDISTRSHEDQNGPPFDERMDRPAPAGCYVSLILCPADNSALQSRVDAIEEIIESNTYHMEKLRSLLVNMPDLVKGLTRIQYGKATPTELATVLVGLNRIATEFKPGDDNAFQSPLLNSILRTLPSIRDQAKNFLAAVSIKEARENDEANLWADMDRYPDIQDAKDVSA
jgi:DNA mismatch repair protein MSH3